MYGKKIMYESGNFTEEKKSVRRRCRLRTVKKIYRRIASTGVYFIWNASATPL